MRINIDVTFEATEEQRVKLANVLDGKVSKRKARRDEFKKWFWKTGKDWEAKLDHEWTMQFGDGGTPEGEADDDEDLLGVAPDDDGMDLI